MAYERSLLPVGTQIETEQGSVYRILGEPVGFGGGSILYPAGKVLRQNGTEQRESIAYVLKECYPVSLEYRFGRNALGEVVAQSGSEEEAAYLHRARQLQLAEGKVSQDIYQTASRILPIREVSQSVFLTLPEGRRTQTANVVTVMDSLSEKGRSLSDWLKEKGRFAPAETMRILQQLLFSLREVHRAGYLHLDIQDGNVFLRGSLEDKSELVTLIDFGCARPLENGLTAPVRDRVIFTTQGYSAPEILLKNDGTLRLGPEADLYSVGCLAMYLLTGQKPDTRRLMANRTGIYLQPNQLRRIQCPRHLTERLQKVLAKALAKDASDRYHSAEEMLAEVTELAEALQPYRSDLATLEYDAFICYKHGPVDSEAAKTLQQKLENFRVPRGVSPKRRPFKRVFVDDGELSSCADFGEQIRWALKNAGWLIVICSPDTPLSPWVKSEIDTFLEYHDRSRILAVLTEGEPETAFPPQLLGAEDGSGEVLAADARGNTLAQVKRKLASDALLRLAAPMLGTAFDSLKQRRKSQAFQRLATMSAAGLALALAFSFYAVKQNQRIQEQYRNNLLSESRYLAALAEDLLEDGDPLGALEIALRALPSESQDRPVVAQARFVAEQALSLYTLRDDNQIQYATAEGILQHTGSVNDSYYWDLQRELLLSCDRDGLYIWDAGTCKLKQSVPFPGGYSSQFRAELVDENRGYAYYGWHNTVFCHDYVNCIPVWQYAMEELDGIEWMAYLPESGRLAVLCTENYDERHLKLLDSGTGRVLEDRKLAISPDAGMDTIYDMVTVSEDEAYAAFVFHSRGIQPEKQEEGLSGVTAMEQESIGILDLVTGELRCLHPMMGAIDAMAFTPQGKLLFTTQDRGISGLYTFLIYGANRSRVVLAEPDSGEILWSLQCGGSSYDNQGKIRFGRDEEELALVSCGNRCVILDMVYGKALGTMELSAPVVQIDAPADRQFRAYTSDGYTYVCSYDGLTWSGMPFWPDTTADVVGENGLYFVKSGDDMAQIRRYNRYPQDENWKQLAELGKISDSSYVKRYINGNDIAVYGQYGENMVLFDADTGAFRQTVLDGAGPDCRIRIEDVLGICPLEGSRNLVFACTHSCGDADHSSYSLLCVDMDTLHRRMLYMPDPEAEDLAGPAETSRVDYGSRLAHGGSRVFFAGLDTFYNSSRELMERIVLYAWDTGSGSSRKIGMFTTPSPDGNEYRTNLDADELIPSPDGNYLLVLDERDDGQGDARTIDLYCLDIEAGDCRNILSGMPLKDSLYGLEGYRVFWDGESTRFAVPRDEDLAVFSLTGELLHTIAYPEAVKTVKSVSFVPGTNHVMILSYSSELSMHDLGGGQIARRVIPSGSLGRIQWQYPREDMLILDHEYGLAVVDTKEETWGITSWLGQGIGYDREEDRFFTLSEGKNSVWNLGFFRRYSVEEIVAMAAAVVGAPGEPSGKAP